MYPFLECYKVSFSVSFYCFCFEVCFVICKYCYCTIFFSCPFAGNIFSQPFTFSLCCSFVLRWVSCRQHMCESCFLIHSATLCLLIGAFNPFTFKVIIDTYLLIFPLLYLCSSLSHSFPSSSYSNHFSISFSVGLVEVYCFSLLLYGKLLISPFILFENLAG